MLLVMGRWSYSATVPAILVLVTAICCSLFEPTQQVINIHRAGSHKTEENNAHTVIDVDMDDDSNEFILMDNTISNKSLSSINYNVMVCSLCSAFLVGLCGIVPILILPDVKRNKNEDDKDGGIYLNRILCFAVGGLLGDVFLHLLPESWQHLQHTTDDGKHSHWPATSNGLWVLIGLISFTFLEKLFPDNDDDKKIEDNHSENNKLSKQSLNQNNNNKIEMKNGHCIKNSHHLPVQNGNVKYHKENLNKLPEKSKVKISGYLNLFANCIDNFTHGLAIAGSYLVSLQVGVMTTFAILLHEIPHEVGDFGILLRAGFDRWKAAKLQILTASGGIVGVFFALYASSAQEAGNQVAWILPFTSGGFLYIALCTVVPDILKETDPRESIIQLFLIVLAIGVMALVGMLHF